MVGANPSFSGPKGVPFFPNVNRLALRNVEYSTAMLSVIVANIPLAFPKTDTLSVFHSGEVSGNEERITSILHPLPVVLWCLEFNIFRENNTGWERILAKFAPKLETLIIRSVQDGPPLALKIPKLPRLKALVILRSFPEIASCRHLVRMRDVGAELRLNFGSEEKLDYAVQFPVLQILAVMPEKPGRRDGASVASCMEFIYDNFLPLGQTPCGTLKQLIIPTTKHLAEKWRLEQCKDCPFLQFRESGVTKANEMGAGFVARVRETFPGLNMGRYRHYLGREVEMEEKRKQNEKKMKEWLQFGQDIGLITGSQGFSLDGS